MYCDRLKILSINFKISQLLKRSNDSHIFLSCSQIPITRLSSPQCSFFMCVLTFLKKHKEKVELFYDREDLLQTKASTSHCHNHNPERES